MVIAGYVPCSLSDYPGLVAAVVFTQGCNWRCPWCHNQGLIPLRARAGTLSREEILSRLERRQGRLDGVVITGGEPSLHKGLSTFLLSVKRLGYRVKLDTNGSQPDVISGLIAQGLVDFIAMDLKAPLERYEEAVGVPVSPETLQASLRLLRNSGIDHHLRTTRWPGLGEADFARIASLAEGSPHVWQEYRKPEPETAVSFKL